MGLQRARRTTCLAVGAATVLASGALAAQSSAAQIALNASCYLNTPKAAATVVIGGSGFFPSSSVDISGGVFGSATTDATGNFLTTVPAPNDTIKPGARAFTVTATDEDFDTGVTATASTTGYYTQAGVALSQDLVGFGKRITYYFGGFRPGKQIYGHYFVGRHQTGRHRFGKATGPCGTLKARATGYPVASDHPDKWTVYFDNVKKFLKSASPTYAEVFRKV